MLKRPKPDEDEEDILRMQEEFLREIQKNESLKPSAQVINLRRTEHQTTKRSSVNESGTRKVSKYAQSKILSQTEKRSQNEPSTSVMGDIVEKNVETSQSEQEDDKVYFPKVIPAVLGDIVEKNVDKFVDFTMATMPSKGFPTATKCNFTENRSKKSIFSMQLEKTKQSKDLNKEESEMDVDSSESLQGSSKQEHPTEPLNVPSKSYILSSKDAEDIHSENVKVLSKMSETEILEEQQKLLSSMDPKLVDFLKARHKATESKISTEDTLQTNEKETDMDTEDVLSNTENDESENIWDNDVLSHPDINKWLHFDSLEKDKLQWMNGYYERKAHKPDEPYEARFDFKGYLLPYTMDYTDKTKTLFHHGEEPHRPGYSITELIELSRSSVTQQRVMALNTIAGILEYHSAGTYKDVIEIPLSKIFFVLRFAIDDNKVIILEAALRAMRNLLYNKLDEACLDALIGFEEGTYQPCLENDKSEIEEMESKESELKDFHLAEIDLISAILRTDIIQRLYYIMDVTKPSFNCVNYCLQILTRLARDSVDTAHRIVETEHLMNAIITHFMPVTGINFSFKPEIVYNGKPMLAALKLMRILTLQCKEIGEILISKYNILKPVSEYISSGVDGTYGLRLQIESYCILSNLVHYDLGIDIATALIPVIVTTLYKHVHGTDIFMNTTVVSSTHAAVVLQLINKMFNCSMFDVEKYGKQIYPLIKEGVMKWLAQVGSIDDYTCGHLRVVSSVLDCCKTILEKAQVPLPFLNDAIKSLPTSKGLKKIISNLVPNSNLISNITDKELYVIKNLMTLGSIVIDSKQRILPVLNVTSPIPFLVSLFKVLVYIDDKDNADNYIKLVKPFVVKIIERSHSLTHNWFTRMEIDLVFFIIRVSLQGNVTEYLKDVVYATTNKLCSSLRADKQFELNFLFDNIIFNKDWVTTERLFHLFSLSEEEGFCKALNSIDEIKLTYSKFVNLNCIQKSPNIVVRKWQEPILPIDWIYLPILSIYSKSQEAPTTPAVTGGHARRIAQKAAEEKESIIRCSLEWIVLNELCFPDLVRDIDVTDRFCRIACVFLCDNSLFLDAQIKILLQKCLKLLFKRAAEFDFTKPLTGLSNFQDLYIQLLEQFQAVSYGDQNFSACILAPLAQHHDVKWRKTLWSEYAGCLRSLDCPESHLAYELNLYLYPEETDESLIKCYFRALANDLVRSETIVETIAVHHSECFANRIDN